MKLFLTENIVVQLDVALSDNHRPNFIFSSSGALVSYGKIEEHTDISSIIDTTIGSDHWVSDNSDFFRFDSSGKMHSLILSVPERNAKNPPKITYSTTEKHSLKLLDLNSAFTVTPQPNRFFDSKSRILYGFDEQNPTSIATNILICDDFTLLFDEKSLYSGWTIKNPIEKIAISFQDRPHFDDVSNITYNIFDAYFKLFSDNSYDEADGEIELVIHNLEKHLNEQTLSSIESTKIREIITKTISELIGDHSR